MPPGSRLERTAQVQGSNYAWSGTESEVAVAATPYRRDENKQSGPCGVERTPIRMEKRAAGRVYTRDSGTGRSREG